MQRKNTSTGRFCVTWENTYVEGQVEIDYPLLKGPLGVLLPMDHSQMDHTHSLKPQSSDCYEDKWDLLEFLSISYLLMPCAPIGK